jgi:tight adherence protein C
MTIAAGAIGIGFALWLFLHPLPWGTFLRTPRFWLQNRISPLLVQAGEPPGRESRFVRRQIFSGAFGVALGSVLAASGGPIFLIATFGLAGIVWPHFRLVRRIQERRRSILLDLPYYLDLITLAVEAGLDLIAAIDEVIRSDRPGPIRDEFQATLRAIRFGESRSRAFLRMAERTSLPPLHLLASAVTQSEELGSSLGGLLRLQSESLRRDLFRRAEEEAQRAPIKLLLPLLGLIFPVVFLLLFAPLALTLFR